MLLSHAEACDEVRERVFFPGVRLAGWRIGGCACHAPGVCAGVRRSA